MAIKIANRAYEVLTSYFNAQNVMVPAFLAAQIKNIALAVLVDAKPQYVLIAKYVFKNEEAALRTAQHLRLEHDDRKGSFVNMGCFFQNAGIVPVTFQTEVVQNL